METKGVCKGQRYSEQGREGPSGEDHSLHDGRSSRIIVEEKGN